MGYLRIIDVDNEYHFWTIKDAKDGDVLATDDGNIFVFDGTVEDDKYPFAYYGLTRRRFESYDRRLPFTHNNIHPASKEQRDQLEKAMADAGYTFDFERKELKKEKVDNLHNYLYGEQKPADKVEPKFEIEEGKWYICIKDLLDNYANRAFRKGDIYLSTQNGSLIPSNSNVPFKIVCPDTYFKDWTIQDAKDGNILASGQLIIIFKEFEEETDWNFVIAYAGIDISGKLQVTNEHWLINNNTKPASKEQRDLLFLKMKEAGYEWDAEKKELKKEKVDNLHNYLYGKQNPTWSEEDIKALNRISTILVDASEVKNWWKEYRLIEREEMIRLTDFLKSLIDRVHSLPKWKPSDEQMKFLCKYAEQNNYDGAILTSLYKDLKKLKEE